MSEFHKVTHTHTNIYMLNGTNLKFDMTELLFESNLAVLNSVISYAKAVLNLDPMS